MAVTIAGPDDGVSDLRWSEDGSLLAAGSWDCAVHVYDLAGTQVQRLERGGPVLGVDFAAGSSSVVSASADRGVAVHDVETGKGFLLGTHDGPVSCVRSVQDDLIASTIVSAGWDGRVKVWDKRNSARCVAEAVLPGKCYDLSLEGCAAALVTKGKKVALFDVRNVGKMDVRESPLMFQPRCIALSKDASSYTIGSVEGRVAVNHVAAHMEVHNFAFKCHRSKDVVFPVNAISYHPDFATTFATGGSDGFVSVWDSCNRKRIYQHAKCESSISSIAFNPSGNCLAIASSYTFELGSTSDEDTNSQIVLQTVKPEHVRPKKQRAKK